MKRRCGHARWVATLLALVALGCAEPEPEIRSVLLLTVDTLRADRLGAYGSARGLTPNLDALAEESLVFEAAYATAPFTFPSIASLFTGLYPGEMGLQNNRSAIPSGVETLATVLHDAGWRTRAVVSNFVLRNKTGLAEGFDEYDDTMDQAEAVRNWPERTAPHTTDAAVAALDALEQAEGAAPWLLWVHYQDPHGPYTPPDGWRERYLAAERAAPRGLETLPEDGSHLGLETIPYYQAMGDEREIAFYRAGYDAEIAYTDAEIGRLLDALEARGLLEETLLVFAADHGEALGEHGFWFAHGHHLTDELVRVPLWVHGPGIEAGRRSDLVSLVDVFPTLAPRLLPPESIPIVAGRDLLAPEAETQDTEIFLATLAGITEPRFGILTRDYKLILTWRNETFVPELFPRGREDINLAAPAPQIMRPLRRRLARLRERYHPEVTGRRQEFSPDEEAQLRALGYIDDGPSVLIPGPDLSEEPSP